MLKNRTTRFFMLSMAVIILTVGLFPGITFTGTEDEAEIRRIERINREIREKGLHWTAGTTSVSRLSAEEKRMLCGARRELPGVDSGLPMITAPAGAVYDPVFDWRAMDGTTPARDQGQCGSCWAFAAVGQLESHIRIYDDRIEDLSEAQTLYCNPYGSGCDGGSSSTAYYIMTHYGQVRESCIPYEQRDDLTCTQTSCEPVAWITGYVSVANDVNSIKEALLTGPVYTTIDIVDRFYDYTSGCFSWVDEVVGYHAVLIVGWDDTKCGGAGAWIIKNSWGADWGENGFGYVEYGNNDIGYGTRQITYLPSNVYVRVIVPDGGDELHVGEEYTIRWTTDRAMPDSLSILLSLDSGANYDHTIASGITATDSLLWVVDDFPVNTARIKVVAWFEGVLGGYDESDADFSIIGKPYRYVSPAGSNYYPYSIPAWAAHSIQDAVDAAEFGDSIMVASSTYTESVGIIKPVYLMGGWNPGFTVRDPSAYPTTISHNGSTVSFVSILLGNPGIEGFTIISGTGTSALLPLNGIYGGGIMTYSAPALIKDNIIEGCGYTNVTNYSAGGGIACYNGSVTITGNTITGCTAQSGGGIYLYQASAVISGNIISGSTPDPEFSGSKFGGGICALHSTVTMSGNSIHSNSGYVNGSGLYLRLSPLTASGDSIYQNESTTNGGGLYGEHSSIALSNCYVTGNLAGSTGGGIYSRAAQFDMENSLVALNDAGIMAGGVYADSSWGELCNNTVDRNVALYLGGNIFLSSAVSLDLRNNFFTYGQPNGVHAATIDNIVFQFNGCYGNTAGDVMTIVPDSTNSFRHPQYSDTTNLDYCLALHSGGIDCGDPAGSDPDGSTADIGMFGGPGAVFSAPDHVQNLSAAALNDTTIEVTWDAMLPGGMDLYAIYSDTLDGFTPDESNFIGTVAADQNTFQHYPVDGCHFYKVNLVSLAGYAGGYSNIGSACTEGTTTDSPDIPSYTNTLQQNYPNPFNGHTTITYSISSPAFVSLRIYDTAGRLVRTLDESDREAGEYRALWNGRDNQHDPVNSGVYFMKMTAGQFKQTRKIVYLR